MERTGENGDIATLGGLFSDADFRRRFAADAEEAATGAGIDVKALPEGALEALGRCSEEELAALYSLRDKLGHLPGPFIKLIV
jgi:hypothetical protein